MAMIEVSNLTKRYRERVAIDSLNFAVPEGKIVGFLGPNGAGKSTTMKILTGFIPPTSGQVRVGGFDVFQSPLEAKKRVGYLPETPPLYPELTVRGYLKFVSQLKAIPSKDIAAEIERVSKHTGIASELDRLCSSLSKGYRQRTGIAQALLGRPALLILDEPTEGLDPRQRHEVLELIKSLAGQHTVVLSTHILAEVKSTCEHVLIIHRGKIVADEPITAITDLETKFIQLTAS